MSFSAKFLTIFDTTGCRGCWWVQCRTVSGICITPKGYYFHGARQHEGRFLGPEFSETEIETELAACGKTKKLSEDELFDTAADTLADEKAENRCKGGWSLGRALGGRSIIADPRSPKMQKQLNLKVKYRESFRPFAQVC